MSLALIDGAEHQIPTPPLMHLSSSVGAYVAAGRYGGTVYRVLEGAVYRWVVPSAIDDPEVWFGFAWRCDRTDNVVGGDQPIMQVFGDGVGTVHLSLYGNSDGSLSLYRGTSSGTLLETSAASVIADATWAYLELHAIIDNSTGEYEVRVDGADVASATGVDTRNGGTSPDVTVVGVTWIYKTDITVTTTVYVDDVYVVTGDGSGASGFQSEISIEGIVPNGAGNHTQLTPVGSATNWQNVDEVPFSSTDYNESPTAGQKDTYTVGNLTATTGSIIGSVIHFAAMKNLAGYIKGRRVIRISSTDYNGADTPSLSATMRYFSEVLPVSVATASAWTISEVNGLEAGFEVRSA